MVTYTKKALIALSLIGSVALYASEDNQTFRRMVITGRGNVVINNGDFVNGTVITQDFRNGGNVIFRCGTFVDHKDDSVKITNSDCNVPVDIKTQKIQLTGVKKRIPLKEAIDTVSLPPYIGNVTINDRDSYIECDEAVFGSNLELKAMNGRLGYKFKKNTSTKFTGTGGKPLCSIYAKLLNGDLIAEHESRVKIDTPNIQNIKTNHSAAVSADENVTLNKLRLLSAAHSSTINLPKVSVPALTSEMAHSAQVTLVGDVAQHNVNIAHDAFFDGSKLKSKYVNINAAHGARAKLWATKMLQGFASFNSRIWYKGAAQNRVGTSWGASCERDNE